jgi:hypothetical protein
MAMENQAYYVYIYIYFFFKKCIYIYIYAYMYICRYIYILYHLYIIFPLNTSQTGDFVAAKDENLQPHEFAWFTRGTKHAEPRLFGVRFAPQLGQHQHPRWDRWDRLWEINYFRLFLWIFNGY